MTIWIDAQHSPAVAFWIDEHFEINAAALRDIGLRDAGDEEIFRKTTAAIFRENANCSKNKKKAKNE
jgi:predicted nuclease of predicted toxin-antitoxin system